MGDLQKPIGFVLGGPGHLGKICPPHQSGLTIMVFQHGRLHSWVKKTFFFFGPTAGLLEWSNQYLGNMCGPIQARNVVVCATTYGVKCCSSNHKHDIFLLVKISAVFWAIGEPDIVIGSLLREPGNQGQFHPHHQCLSIAQAPIITPKNWVKNLHRHSCWGWLGR